jgi:hypothetical protein
MSPIFLSDAETDKQTEEYKRCIEQHPCKHDDKQLLDIPEEEQHGVYHCRVKRHLACTLPESE